MGRRGEGENDLRMSNVAIVGYLKPAIVVDYAQLVVDYKLLLLQLVALCSRLQVYGSRLQ